MTFNLEPVACCYERDSIVFCSSRVKKQPAESREPYTQKNKRDAQLLSPQS